MNFSEVADAIWSVATFGSKLTKEQLLRKYADLDGFKEVLRYIYDPGFTTGIKVAKLDKWRHMGMEATETSAEDIMDYLRTYNTGSDTAVIAAVDFIEQYEDDSIEAWLAEGLVTKDLQIGVSVTTLNKVFGKGFIPKIGIMRGMHCPPNARGEFICTEKIDGNRRLVFVRKPLHEGAEVVVDIYTRSGKPDTGLPELVDEAKRCLPPGYVYDCECVAAGSYSDNIALRQASASLLNRGGNRTGIKALAFDMVAIPEYEREVSILNAIARKAMLAKAMRDDHDSILKLQNLAMLHDHEHGSHWLPALQALLSSVPTQLHELHYFQALPVLGIAMNFNEGLKLAQPIWDARGEGIMMVEASSPYEVNPNPRKTLLKIKATQEFTLRCIGVVEGDNKYSGMLGAIEVEYQRPGDPYKYCVKVGSGFADYQRAAFWQNPESIIGKMVEVESFGESVNKEGIYSLNCPIFKRIVGDVD